MSAAAGYPVGIGREEDGRWIAEVACLPGVLVYGASEEEAIRRARLLAAQVVADRLEHGEGIPPWRAGPPGGDVNL